MNQEMEDRYSYYIERRNKADKIMGEIIITYMEPDTSNHVLLFRAMFKDHLITKDEYELAKEFY